MSILAGSVSACAGLAVGGPDSGRPGWLTKPPTANDSLYFVGSCSAQASFQEGLECARSEAMLDVAAWLGGRVSARVYRQQSATASSSVVSVSFDAGAFLSDVQRVETYHEVRESVGRPYHTVGVLLAYPRRAAVAEKERIEEETRQAVRRVEEVAARALDAAGRGRWGEAVEAVLAVAGTSLGPANLERGRHAERLAAMLQRLIDPLSLDATIRSGRLEVQAMLDGVPVAGLPLVCFDGMRRRGVVTGPDGQAACELKRRGGVQAASITVRPEASRYLNAVPENVTALSAVIGRMLDHSITIDLPPTVDYAVAIVGAPGCGEVREIIEARLRDAGVRTRAAADGVVTVWVVCGVEDRGPMGRLHTVRAHGTIGLCSEGEAHGYASASAYGLGQDRRAAQTDAVFALGEELGRSAMSLLRERDVSR